MNKRQRMRRRTAAKLPAYMRDIAFVKDGGRFNRERIKARKLGTFGAASAVRVLVKDGKPTGEGTA